MTEYRISQLARRAGLRPTTLRFYEREGLLPSRRGPNGYRVYDEIAVDRLAFVAAGKRLGLPLTEIRELLTVWRDGLCRDVRRELRPMLCARIADARARTAELDAFVRLLDDALAEIDGPERPGRCEPGCGFLQLRAPSAAAEPVACSLDGDEHRERIARWHAVLAEAVSREPLDDGVRVVFPATRAGIVAELAADEQRCCRFFAFTLRFAHETVELDVRAPAEAAPLLAELVGG